MHNQETSQAPLHSRDPGSLETTGGVTLKIMPFTYVHVVGGSHHPSYRGWTTSILGSPAVASAEHLSERALQCDFLGRGLWDVGNRWEILYKWRDQWNDASMNGGKCIKHALNG